METTHEEKLSHLNDLLTLSAIDGQASQVEMSFIYSVADRLGIDREELNLLREGKLNFKLSTPRYQKQIMEQFHRLIILMGIDKMIFEEELDFCIHLGVKMGLNYHAILEVLRKVIKNPAHILPVDEMEAIFNKYSN